MEKVLEILKLAVEKEHVRAAAYRDAATKTNNALAKATFEALAKDEEKHEKYLNAYYAKQVANEGWPPVAEIVEDGNALAVVQEIFKYANQQIGAVGDTSGDLEEVYQSAIDAEIESVHVYKDAMRHASDPNAKAFFKLLVEVEQMHAKLLSDTQEYLTDTSKWFFDEEQWIVEG